MAEDLPYARVVDILRTAMQQQNVSQSELARGIGITQSAIAQILSGRTARSKYIPEIARFLRIDLDQLIEASGGRSVVITPGEVRLAEIDMSYSMGGGSFLEDIPDQRTTAFDPEWLASITRSPPRMLFIARGIGDSMAPTLLDNDTLLIDRGNRTLSQQDRIWAITYGDLGMIKRVRRTADGVYHLMSDNPQISPIEATDGELHIVGRVCWVGRKV